MVAPPRRVRARGVDPGARDRGRPPRSRERARARRSRARARDPLAQRRAAARGRLRRRPRRLGQKRRRLQIQTGISGSLVAAFLVGIPTALFLPSTCRDPDPDFGCGEGYVRAYGSIMLAAAAVVTVIPTIVYGVRLDRHWLDRPVPRRFALAPGGLTLRFEPAPASSSAAKSEA
ncbi:hypothetical protein [Nannocystis pusilla]|uniref:hypothetical protein n=1 Tax=Nannocystis pusilla TaxID=889268 RepID=UPI003B810511